MGVRAVGVIVGAMLVCAAIVLPVGGAGAQGGADPAKVGSFSQPFIEPTVSDFAGYPRIEDRQGLRRAAETGSGSRQPGADAGFIDCKPAAGGLTHAAQRQDPLLGQPGGHRERGAARSCPSTASSSSTTRRRLLDADAQDWTEPTPVDGGANPRRPTIDPLIPGELSRPPRTRTTARCSAPTTTSSPTAACSPSAARRTRTTRGDGGRPSSARTELQGVAQHARLRPEDQPLDARPATMNYGRWYPTLVTLGDAAAGRRQFVASGVQEASSSPYDEPDPTDPTASARRLGTEGDNVQETEIFDTWRTGEWALQGRRTPRTRRRSLPLFPRLHLLPNGHVYYNAAGQAFNPIGPGLRRGAVEHRGGVRPGDQALERPRRPGRGHRARCPASAARRSR